MQNNKDTAETIKTCNIVGLKNYTSKRLSEFVGQRLRLTREPWNIYDDSAVAAYDGEHQIGHVRSKECKDFGIAKMIEEQPNSEVYAIVKDVDDGYNSLIVDLPIDCKPYLKTDDPWQRVRDIEIYPVFEPKGVFARLDTSLSVLLEKLEDKGARYEDVNTLLLDYLKIEKYGLSADFKTKRRRLYKTIKYYPSSAIQLAAKEIEDHSKETHTPEAHDCALQELLACFRKQAEDSEYDVSASYLEEYLNRFPKELFSKYKQNKSEFSSTLYYCDIPRLLLFRFVSALVLWEKAKTKYEVEELRRKKPIAISFCCPEKDHKLMKTLEYLLNRKMPKEAMAILYAAIELGLMTMPTYNQIKHMPKPFITQTQYYHWIDNRPNDKDIEAFKNILSRMMGA